LINSNNIFFYSDVFIVKFDDDVQYNATAARIKGNGGKWEIGTRIEARYTDGYWYSATIMKLPGR